MGRGVCYMIWLCYHDPNIVYMMFHSDSGHSVFVKPFPVLCC